jgi:hypothetical protein
MHLALCKTEMLSFVVSAALMSPRKMSIEDVHREENLLIEATAASTTSASVATQSGSVREAREQQLQSTRKTTSCTWLYARPRGFLRSVCCFDVTPENELSEHA